MNNADLHLHTRYSDGYSTVDDIVQKAVEAHLTHIAITDHDNLDGWAETFEKAKAAGLKTVKSVEVSAMDYVSRKVVHVLGYNIKEEAPIRTICDPIKQMRNDKAYIQVKKLNELGYHIDFDELFQYAKGYIFKQHIFEMLYRTNQVEAMFPSINETLFRYPGALYYHMEYIDVIEAIKAIKAAGGYAVLAHPNQQNNIDTVDRVYRYGLDGIEYNHESNKAEYMKIIKEYAQKYDLILTGGSDYHGAYARRREIVGSYLSEESGYKVFE